MIRTLVKQSAAYGIATVFSRGMQVLTLLLLPLVLRPVDYGAFQILLTLGILVTFVAPLEISQGLARYYPGADQENGKHYASTAAWFTGGALALFLILSTAFSEQLCSWILGDLSYLRSFRLGVTFIALNGFFFFLQSQCRYQFDLVGYACISLAYALATIMATIGLALVIEPAIDGVLMGQAIGALVGVFFGLFRLRKSLQFNIDYQKLKSMLHFTLPLVPANIAVFGSVYGSRLILTSEATLTEVGLFTYASQIGAIGSLAILGVNAALTPMIMAHHEDIQTPPTIARLFEGFVALALLICLALGLFARDFIYFFGNIDYMRSAQLVIFLAPAMLMTQMYIFAPGFAIAKKTTWQLWVSLIGAGVSIAANLVLIRYWGEQGAAWATLLAATVFLVGWFVASDRLYPLPIRWKSVSIGLGVFATLAAIGLLAQPSHFVFRTVYNLLLIMVAALVYTSTGLIPRMYVSKGMAMVRRRLES